MSQLFEDAFGTKPDVTQFAPGRVNLIGEYTDLVGGHVLPMPLAKGITVEAGRSEKETRAYSHLQGETVTLDLGGAAQSRWTDYVVGSLVMLQSAGIALPAMNLSISSTLPAGAGVSSSAALEIAVMRAALALAGISMTEREIALLAQRAENEFCGVQCGIMDQMAIAEGTAGNALSLNCTTLAARNIALPSDWCFAVIHCGQDRQLVGGAYNDRRAAVEAAATALGKDLKDCTLAMVGTLGDPVVRRRARHIVSEQARVGQAVEAFKDNAISRFGRLMNESHASLADDFEVSTPALDTLVNTARQAGAHGARLTGAGFGGCIVALLDASWAEAWWRQVALKQPDAWCVQL